MKRFETEVIFVMFEAESLSRLRSRPARLHNSEGWPRKSKCTRLQKRPACARMGTEGRWGARVEPKVHLLL